MSRFNAAATAVAQLKPQPEPPATAHLSVLPPPAAPAAGNSRPKLNFGGLATKQTAALAASDYPVLPDPDGHLAKIAEAFLDAHAAEEAATGAKEANRFELVKAAMPFHFSANAGRAEIPSSVAVLSPKGEVRVTFKDSYKKLNDVKYEAVRQVIGDELASSYMTQTFEFNIKSEKIPEALMQSVIDGITELATRLGIADAVAVATCYKPTAEWHTARFRRLSAEQNMKLEATVDREKGFCTAAVGPARKAGR